MTYTELRDRVALELYARSIQTVVELLANHSLLEDVPDGTSEQLAKAAFDDADVFMAERNRRGISSDGC